VYNFTLERQGDRLQWSNNKFDDTAAWMIRHWSCTGKPVDRRFKSDRPHTL